jgi:uncharacterized protein YndB with AHSA1/START domain
MPTLETSAAPALFLEQIRVVNAPRTRVYQAWTNPETMKQWFGPSNRNTTEINLDVREGGAYRIEMQIKPEFAETVPQPLATVAGAYTKVVPNELLQFTWNPSWSAGEDSLVTVLFEDARGGTQVTIRHERFSTEQSRNGHNSGWSGALDKLAAVCEQQ